jgi:hypothetical protein
MSAWNLTVFSQTWDSPLYLFQQGTIYAFLPS